MYAFVTGLLGLALASGASALSVDFRDPAFAPRRGASEHEVVHEGYRFGFGALNIESMRHDGSLYWDSRDGFGIIGAGWERDEIELPEVLRLSFGESLFVEQLVVTDLFVEGSDRYAEQGLYSLDGGLVWTPFESDGIDDNGEMTVIVNGTADYVLLTTAGRGRAASGRSFQFEFSLAGVAVERAPGPLVPEPSTALLFVLAVWIVGRFGRLAFRRGSARG